MATSPEVTSALTVASAFLIASLSITVIVYALQWNHFNSKGVNRERVEEIRLKDLARGRTLLVFVAEFSYIAMALGTLIGNIFAILGNASPEAALFLSIAAMVVFAVLLSEEIGSSILHLRYSKYVD